LEAGRFPDCPDDLEQENQGHGCRVELPGTAIELQPAAIGLANAKRRVGG